MVCYRTYSSNEQAGSGVDGCSVLAWTKKKKKTGWDVGSGYRSVGVTLVIAPEVDDPVAALPSRLEAGRQR